MQEELEKIKEKVNQRIKSMGIKKQHLAKQMGLDPVRFSQTMNGKRNITADEFSILKSTLGIS